MAPCVLKPLGQPQSCGILRFWNSFNLLNPRCSRHPTGMMEKRGEKLVQGLTGEFPDSRSLFPRGWLPHPGFEQTSRTLTLSYNCLLLLGLSLYRVVCRNWRRTCLQVSMVRTRNGLKSIKSLKFGNSLWLTLGLYCWDAVTTHVYCYRTPEQVIPPAQDLLGFECFSSTENIFKEAFDIWGLNHEAYCKLRHHLAPCPLAPHLCCFRWTGTLREVIRPGLSTTLSHQGRIT